MHLVSIWLTYPYQVRPSRDLFAPYPVHFCTDFLWTHELSWPLATVPYHFPTFRTTAQLFELPVWNVNEAPPESMHRVLSKFLLDSLENRTIEIGEADFSAQLWRSWTWEFPKKQRYQNVSNFVTFTSLAIHHVAACFVHPLGATRWWSAKKLLMRGMGVTRALKKWLCINSDRNYSTYLPIATSV